MLPPDWVRWLLPGTTSGDIQAIHLDSDAYMHSHNRVCSEVAASMTWKAAQVRVADEPSFENEEGKSVQFKTFSLDTYTED